MQIVSAYMNIIGTGPNLPSGMSSTQHVKNISPIIDAPLQQVLSLQNIHSNQEAPSLLSQVQQLNASSSKAKILWVGGPITPWQANPIDTSPLYLPINHTDNP